MMCNELAEELSHFDLQKEKELKQVLVDYAGAQLERHEKVCVCVCARKVAPGKYVIYVMFVSKLCSSKASGLQ